MKIKYGFVISEVAGERVAVSAGSIDHVNVAVTLNKTGEFLWKMLTEGTDIDSMVKALVATYHGVDEATAREHTEKFVQTLRDKGMLEE